MATVRFQFLWHDVVVAVPSSEVAQALDYFAQSVVQLVPIERCVSLEVCSPPGGYVIEADGQCVDTASNARGVLDAVYRRVHNGVFEEASRKGWVRVHGVTVDLGDRRIVLVGPSGVGKTTLALRLLFDGALVRADESFLLKDGQALPVPRPFHLKAGIEEHVPEVAGLLPSLPVLDGDLPVRPLDLAQAGFSWEIRALPVDAVVVLERGATHMNPVAAIRAMHDIVSEVFLLHEGKKTVVREIAAMLRDAPCYRLYLDDVAEASQLVRSMH